MGSFSIWHWLIVLAVVILVFGTKKLGSLGSDVGSAIKNFKKAVNDGEAEGEQVAKQIKQSITGADVSLLLLLLLLLALLLVLLCCCCVWPYCCCSAAAASVPSPPYAFAAANKHEHCHTLETGPLPICLHTHPQLSVRPVYRLRPFLLQPWLTPLHLWAVAHLTCWKR